MNQFWHRRVCEGVMFVAGMIIALYFWTFFTGNNGVGLLVDSISVIVSGIAFLLGAVSYLWTPTKYITWASTGLYLLLAATAGSLVATSQGLNSPFIALWILVAIFAGVFGATGIVAMFIAGSSYLFLGIIHSTIGQSVIVTTVIAGWLPLVASFIIWHSRRMHDESKDRTYRNLASELSEVANKAEVVINAIADGVVAVNSEGIIQLINPAAQEITGWGKQDATSLSYKSVLKLTDKDDAELTNANDPVQTVLATNREASSNDLMLATNSGKKLLVSVIVSPVGQLGAGAIIVFRDITKQRKEEREQAEFISTASHEMRTPVASIEGYLGLALNPQTATIDAKARDFITKAHESAQHLGRLFQDLLDITKADDGRLANNPKVVDVVQLAHDIMEGLKPQATAKGLRFLYKPIPEDDTQSAERHLSPVFYSHVDNDHLREIIANLIENAIKYTPKGDVVVDVNGDNEHVIVSVADSGIGIPAEDVGHLFQKFYRVDNSDTREIGGTGLGLYLCRRLAELMGGRIWVESEYKKGSTFFVELPRIDHEEAMRLIDTAAEEKEDYPSIIPDSSHVRPQPDDTSNTGATESPIAVPQLVASPAQTSPAPAPQPVAPVAPAAPTVPPPAPAPVVTVDEPALPIVILADPTPSTAPTNTPISAIEQNPTQYTQQTRAASITVPVRENNSQQQ